jgi:hypothetical protein
MLDRLKRLFGRAPESETCPDCGAGGQQTYCSVCGYDLINQTRAAKRQPPST